ncbi:MAG: NHL repeat-containing protein [Chloroflexota bacterium]
MLDDRFDALLRALGGARSRREALAAAAALLAGGTAASQAAARRARRGNRRPAAAGPCGNGSAKDNRCEKNRDCCTKYCPDGACRCKPNYLTCASSGECCSKSCVNGRCDGGCVKDGGTKCTENFNCCNGLVCDGGACKPSARARCNPGNCPGCCIGTVCRPGGSATACGAGGGACAGCGAGQTCAAGTCGVTGCSPANCPSGCCKGGQCQAGTANDACGAAGASCAACGGAKPLCKNRVCAAGTWTAQTPLGTGQGSGNSQFDIPNGVAITPDGLELFVADTMNNRVTVWSRASIGAAWQAQTPLGRGAPSSGTSNDQFWAPMDVAIQSDGLTLYVADDKNSRVCVWKRASRTAAWQAQTPLGNGGGSDNDQFFAITGVAVSADGLTMCVADPGNERVDFWTRAATSAAWQAGTPIGAGFGEANDKFGYPYRTSLSANGLELYVADQGNNRITIWTRASANAAWQAQAPLGGVNMGSANNEFSDPYGLALAPNGLTLYVADTNNYRIAVWTRATATSAWQAATPLGNGQGQASNQFDAPQTLALPADGLEFFVVDSGGEVPGNNRITAWKYV